MRSCSFCQRPQHLIFLLCPVIQYNILQFYYTHLVLTSWFVSLAGGVLEFATASVNLAHPRLSSAMTWKTCQRGRMSSTHTGRLWAAARTVRETLHRNRNGGYLLLRHTLNLPLSRVGFGGATFVRAERLIIFIVPFCMRLSTLISLGQRWLIWERIIILISGCLER